MEEVDTYLHKLDPAQRAELVRIRSIVRKLVPDAEESISYALPTFKYKGRPLLYYGAFKNHMSLFATAQPTKALEPKLKGYKVSKGTIQFTVDNPLSDAIIREIIQIRLKAIG